MWIFSISHFHWLATFLLDYQKKLGKYVPVDTHSGCCTSSSSSSSGSIVLFSFCYCVGVCAMHDFGCFLSFCCVYFVLFVVKPMFFHIFFLGSWDALLLSLFLALLLCSIKKHFFPHLLPVHIQRLTPLPPVKYTFEHTHTQTKVLKRFLLCTAWTHISTLVQNENVHLWLIAFDLHCALVVVFFFFLRVFVLPAFGRLFWLLIHTCVCGCVWDLVCHFFLFTNYLPKMNEWKVVMTFVFILDAKIFWSVKDIWRMKFYLLGYTYQFLFINNCFIIIICVYQAVHSNLFWFFNISYHNSSGNLFVSI